MLHDNEPGLKEEFPKAWEELNRARAILERHFKDACDIDFTIQRGRLYILSARPAKRTPRAALRIALDFFREGIISEDEVISRLSLEDLYSSLRTKIDNLEELVLFCRGLPASPGVATGQLLLDATRASEYPAGRFIFVAPELSPEHLGIMDKTSGLVTQRGGMTSHAAVIARGLRLPCVTGSDELEIDIENRSIHTHYNHIVEGSWITIDGSEGLIYAGEARFVHQVWETDPNLSLLARLIEVVLLRGSLSDEDMAKAWLLRDMLLHSWAPPIDRIRKGYNYRPTANISLTLTDAPDNTFGPQIDSHPAHMQRALVFIFQGLLSSLGRLIGHYVGLGQHYRMMRPMWDLTQSETSSYQMVGIEFFDINRYIHHLVDISSIRLVFAIYLDDPGDAWRLDKINPRGTSIIPGSMAIAGSALWVNDAKVNFQDLPSFYHFLRRREYYGQWIEKIRDDLIHFLKPGTDTRNSKLRFLASQFGLIENNQLTLAGRSLVMQDEPASCIEKTV